MPLLPATEATKMAWDNTYHLETSSDDDPGMKFMFVTCPDCYRRGRVFTVKKEEFDPDNLPPCRYCLWD